MRTLLYLLGAFTLLIVSAQAQAVETIIRSGDSWKYWANTAAPGTNNWKGGQLYNDLQWVEGPSPLGYSPGGVDGESTTIATGCGLDVYNCQDKFPTIYFRKTFTITNINDYEEFVIRYKRDDGIVLYVNGAEIKREFMPDGIITQQTSATAGPGTGEGAWQLISAGTSGGFNYPRMFLRTGINVIAAEVHQTDVDNPLNNSTDLRFDLELDGVRKSTPSAVKIVRGPYLQMGTTSSMIIRWTTEALTRGQVRYDTIPTNLTPGNGQVISESGLRSDHQIKLINLKPNKKYYYIIEATEPGFAQLEGTASAASTHFFYTAPLPGTAKKTRIWALGDFGSDDARHDSVRASFQTYKQLKGIDYVDLWLWMGDNAYDWGLDEHYQQRVFDKVKARYDWVFRQTPFYATPGNHDYQSNHLAGGLRYKPHPIHYYDVVNNFTETTDGGGGVPSHQEEYYSFNYNNIHFVSLDSYGFENEPGQGTAIFNPTAAQLTWLKQDLTDAKANPAIHWVIVYWHHPPYTWGSYDSDNEAELTNIRTNIIKVLDDHHVDMVINGHSHVYERSRLMTGLTGPSTSFTASIHNSFLAGNAQSSGRYDGSPNSCFYYKNTTSKGNEGVIYVVNGAGGRSNYPRTNLVNPAKFINNPVMAARINEGGSFYIEVEGKRLDAKFVGVNGTVKDQFTIFKDSEGFTVPPTDGTTRTAVCECTDTLKGRGFTHYVDPSGNLLLSIKKYNNNIGRVGTAPFDLKVQGNPGVTRINAYSPTNYVRLAPYRYRNLVPPWIAFNRHWTLTPGTELTGNNQVIVRQYFTEADMTALNAPYLDDPMGIGNLKPYKINDGPSSYTISPASGHTAIPQAAAYNRPGAWVYDARVDGTRGAYPTTHWWMRGEQGKGSYYGEYVVGRLKGGGGFGAPSNFQSNPSGHKDRASQMWSYLVSSTEPTGDWKTWNQFFDASGWQQAYLPLGYSPQGEDQELTQIANGCPPPNDLNTNCPTKNITTYFRGFLNYGGPTYNYQSYILNYRRNDGVIIYIDGKEVLPRDPNMPAPPAVITPTTLALENKNELEWRTVVLPSSAVTGIMIAIELHQSSRSSNDLHLNVELIGTPDLATTPIGLRSSVLTDEEVRTLPVLYPNPVRDGKVFLTEPMNFQSLQLTDLQGKTYRYIAQPGSLTELDVSSLPAGLYILTSQGATDVSRYRIIKQ